MTQVGQNIGPFVLERWLHSSTTRSLFYAPNPKGTRNLTDAAIYVLHQNIRTNEEIAKFQQDFQFLSMLEHPNLPKILHQYPSQYAYARTWIEGVSLSELIRLHHEYKIPIDMATIWDIIYSIAETLQYLHRKDVVCGRLNLDHILLSHTGDIYLIGLHSIPEDNVPHCSPPEQASQAFVDWRSDQWSLGAILVALILKEPLYTGRSNPIHAAIRCDTHHWLDRVYMAHPELQKLLSVILHPAAGERIQEEHALMKKLQQWHTQSHHDSKRELLAHTAYAYSQQHQELQQQENTVLPHRKVLIPQQPKKNPPIVFPNHEPNVSFEQLDVTEQLEPLLGDIIVEPTNHIPPAISRHLSHEEFPTAEPVVTPTKSSKSSLDSLPIAEKLISSQKAPTTTSHTVHPQITEVQSTASAPSVPSTPVEVELESDSTELQPIVPKKTTPQPNNEATNKEKQTNSPPSATPSSTNAPVEKTAKKIRLIAREEDPLYQAYLSQKQEIKREQQITWVMTIASFLGLLYLIMDNL